MGCVGVQAVTEKKRPYVGVRKLTPTYSPAYFHGVYGISEL